MGKASNINESIDDKRMLDRVKKHATEQIQTLSSPKISRFDTCKVVATIYNTFSSSEEIRLLNFHQEPAADVFRAVGVGLKRIKGVMAHVGVELKHMDNKLGELYRVLDARKLQTTALPDMVWDIDAMMSDVREIRNKIDDSNPSEKQVETVFNALTAWGQTPAFKSAIKTDTWVNNSVKSIVESREYINKTLVEFQSLYGTLIYNYKQLLTAITAI